MIVREGAPRRHPRRATARCSRRAHAPMVLGVDPTSLRPQDEKQWPQLAALIGMPRAGAAQNLSHQVTASPRRRLPFRRPRRRRSPRAWCSISTLAPRPTPRAASRDGRGRRRRGRFHARRERPAGDSLGEAARRRARAALRGDREARDQGRLRRSRLPPRVSEQAARGAHHRLRERQQEAVAGIEAYADFYLRGQNGWRVGERDGRNRELPQFLTRQVPPSDGYSVDAFRSTRSCRTSWSRNSRTSRRRSSR